MIGVSSRTDAAMPTLPPIPETFTQPIATRAMTVTRDGRTEELHLEIGQPVQDVETVAGTDWRCPVRWRDGSTIRVHNACGIDSFQALQLALESIRLRLEVLAGEEGVSLRFLDGPCDVRTQLPDLGHPRGATAARPRAD